MLLQQEHGENLVLVLDYFVAAAIFVYIINYNLRCGESNRYALSPISSGNVYSVAD